MYLLADLAMQDLLGVSSDPKNLYIDYIRVYSNDPNATPAALEPISSPDGVDTSNLYGASYARLSVSSGETFTISSGNWHRRHCRACRRSAGCLFRRYGR